MVATCGCQRIVPVIVFGLAAAAAAQAGSYRVYPLPVGSPDHGVRQLLINPHDPAASPFGWHDTDGVPGAEFTVLRGNNVWVYLDQDNDNLPDGPGPDGGAGLVFDYPAAPGVLAPLTYADALATNAFYLGNMVHDILWHHGFREADGNFQENNYGNGGLGGDAMRIEIFNGGGVNNANNTNTPDGTASRIQLYVWNMTDPHREPSFEASVLAWAYMQAVQRRLGGLTCFGNQENPAFGYADFLGILITNDFATTTPATPRGLATWLAGQPVNGPGVRAYPYSVDMSVNPLTYADSASFSTPAWIGTIFGSALWDLAWRLVEREGASGDMVTGDGGENRVLRLVIEALKRQTCNAGLVDARNALLAADQHLYGGAYQCDIWDVFARRGLGFSAQQGSPTSVLDNVAAFDVFGSCERLFADGFELPSSTLTWGQYCSTAGTIDLPAGQPATTSGPASPYPVPINVAGIPSPVAALRVQVFGLSHTFPDDLDVLLVGPGGQPLVIQSDVGGGTDVVNLSYVLDDLAPDLLPDHGPLTAGTFRPSNVITGDSFPAPAPLPPHNDPAPAGTATLNGTFGGSQPNGTWKLYLVDDVGGDVGTLAGLCLEIGWQP